MEQRECGRFIKGLHYSSPTEIKSGEHLSILTQIKPGFRLSPETEFKRGQTAHNYLPLGSVTIRTDPNKRMRAWVKVAEPSQWRLRAVVVWEKKHNCALTRGRVVHHKDGNSLNDMSTNLVDLTRKQHIDAHRDDLLCARGIQRKPI